MVRIYRQHYATWVRTRAFIWHLLARLSEHSFSFLLRKPLLPGICVMTKDSEQVMLSFKLMAVAHTCALYVNSSFNKWRKFSDGMTLSFAKGKATVESIRFLWKSVRTFLPKSFKPGNLNFEQTRQIRFFFLSSPENSPALMQRRIVSRFPKRMLLTHTKWASRRRIGWKLHVSHILLLHLNRMVDSSKLCYSSTSIR